MIWYIVICIMMLYPLGISYAGSLSGKKTQRVALQAACVILWFFLAMRNRTVGVDTKYYSYVFTQFSDIPLQDVFRAVTYATAENTWTFDFEPGYRLINKVVSWFSVSPQAITIVNGTLIIVLLYFFIRNESADYLLSIWLYITLGVYQTEMNVTRNAIAILIVYNGLSYARNRKFFRYLCVCLLAASIHKAAFVFIFLYWLCQCKLQSPGKALFLLVVACGTGIIFPTISPYLKMIVPDSFAHYLETSAEKGETIIVGILNGGVFLLCYFLLNRKERSQVFSTCHTGIMMLMLNLCTFGLNLGLSDAARMAALFGPYLIVLIPQVLNLIDSEIRKRDATAIIAIICGVQYFFRLCINNIGGTMPYSFFW